MIIQSKKVWIADQFVPAIIEMDGGKIVSIAPYGSKAADVDYGDKRIVPGFIDIHCHGAYTFDTNDAHEEGLRNWAKNIVDEGVTAFLATTITQSVEVLTNAVANVAKVMEDAIPCLNEGGRLAIITFHSLEDRIVKTGMVAASKGCTCPPNFPVCVCGKKPQVKLVNRKPIVSGEIELERNPRARSAKLRVCEKL